MTLTTKIKSLESDSTKFIVHAEHKEGEEIQSVDICVDKREYEENMDTINNEIRKAFWETCKCGAFKKPTLDELVEERRNGTNGQQ